MSHLSQETLSQAMHWLVNGSTGLSSKCLLATIIHGQPIQGGWNATFHPRDPSDLKRCISLLDAAPELRNHLNVMQEVSNEWNVLIKHWADLEAMFKEELQVNPNKAPLTLKFMRELFAEVA
ncbi:hypothetical protein [Acinetobacter johnsonii]|uniref:hypothetical protein n=1 Tax=Acinetobacter johnsonii TaxID=40214 RepID=UPI0030095570